MATHLTIHDVAERYKTSKDTVYRWLRGDNSFPRPMRLPTGGTRWTVAQLDRWDAAETAVAA